MKYLQKTFVNDKLEYEPRFIEPDKLVQMLANLILFKQAGDDIELPEDVDSKYCVTKYIVYRTRNDGTVVRNEFEVFDD